MSGIALLTYRKLLKNFAPQDGVSPPDGRFVAGLNEYMKLQSYSAVPRFKIGDGVIVLTPGSEKGKEGVVSGVIGHTGDFVYRYDVLFRDGKSKRFFGFEIELIAQRIA